MTRPSLLQRLPPLLERSIRILRHPAGAIERHRILRRLKAEPTELPDRSTLHRLKRSWGGGAVADVDYLAEVCRRARSATTPILECGSGLTTLLLAIYAEVPVWSLEQSDRWAKRMHAALRWYRLTGVTVAYAPIRSHGDYDWFVVPPGLPDRIGLVVCDGPVSHHRSGMPRYGVVPTLRERFSPGAVILLDDAHRPSETAVLERWKAEGLQVDVRRVQSRWFAVATVGEDSGDSHP